MDRVVYFLKSAKQAIQHRCGIEQLKHLLPHEPAECERRVLPLLRKFFVNGTGKDDHRLQVIVVTVLE